MSFILDALKKSEKERQRSAVPGIGDLPVVVQHARPSAWAITLIAGLGLAVVGLGVAWWRSTTQDAVAVVDVPARSAAPAAAEPAPPRAPVEQRAPTETRSLASEATRVAEAVRPTPAAPPPARAGVAQPTAPSSGRVTTAPMSITEARLAGMPVPELTLELLVFSSDPAKRFVFINSAKYAEGDTLPEGPELVEITNTGAVLSYRGQVYMLPQN